MRWKITLSYLPVAARVAKFLQVCDVSVSGWGLVLGMVVATYSRALLGEECDDDVADVGVHYYALGVVGLVCTG